jgi:hypothetical protein
MTGDTFGDWATAVGAGATIGLFGAALWAGHTASSAGRTARTSVTTAATGIRKQIDEQRAIELRRRVYDHLSRFYSGDFTELNADLQKLLRSFESDPSKGQAAWKAMDDHAKARILTVLNFYELVATEYNAEFLDRDVANRHLAYIAVAMWEAARKFIAWLREKDSAYFQDWERLYECYGASIIAAARDEQDTTDAPISAQTRSVSTQLRPLDHVNHVEDETG